MPEMITIIRDINFVMLSMGGFLAADSALEFVKTRPDQEGPLWPKVIACITFDTPVWLSSIS